MYIKIIGIFLFIIVLLVVAITFPRKTYIEKYSLSVLDKNLITEILNLIYPRNSLYITVNNSTPKSILPYLSNSNWSIVGSGKIIMTGLEESSDNSNDVIGSCILSSLEVPNHTHKILLANDSTDYQSHKHTYTSYHLTKNLDGNRDDEANTSGYVLEADKANDNTKTTTDDTDCTEPDTSSHSHPLFVTNSSLSNNLYEQLELVNSDNIVDKQITFDSDNIMIDCNTTLNNEDSKYLSAIIHLNDAYYIIMIESEAIFDELDSNSKIVVTKDKIEFTITGTQNNCESINTSTKKYTLSGTFSDGSNNTNVKITETTTDTNNNSSTNNSDSVAYLYKLPISLNVTGHTHTFSESQIPKFYVKVWKRNDDANTNTKVTINEKKEFIQDVLNKIFPVGSIIICINDLSNYELSTYLSNWVSISGQYIPISVNSELSLDKSIKYSETSDDNGDANGTLTSTCGHILQTNEIPIHSHVDGKTNYGYYSHTHRISALDSEKSKISFHRNRKNATGYVSNSGNSDKYKRNVDINDANSANHSHTTEVTSFGVDKPEAHSHSLNLPSFNVKIYYRSKID